jgi:hypothetical protein
VPVPPRDAESTSQPLLAAVLTLLILLASASLLHTLFSRLPPAAELPTTPPRVPGYRLLPLPGASASAGRELARGSWRRYRVLPARGGPALSLSLLPVHSRSHRRFQLAALTRGAVAPAGLSLQGRRLIPGSPSLAMGWLPSSSPAVNAASGVADGSVGPVVPALQTCLLLSPPGTQMASLEGGVTEVELLGLLIPRSQGGAGLAGAGKDLGQLLGLEPNVRWECVVVTVAATKTTNKLGQEADLLRFWERTRQPLAAWLAAPGLP